MMNQEAEKLKIGIFTTGLEAVSAETTKASEIFTFGLAEGLSKQGHKVHLFGAVGSKGNFKVVEPRHSVETAKNINGLYEYCAYTSMNFLDFVAYCQKNEIDIIHDQTSEMTITLANILNIPVVSTLHGVRPPSNLSEYYKLNRAIKFISPSQFVINSSPDLNFIKVIPHGVDINKFVFQQEPGDYFLWVGRIIPEKGLDDAISAAINAGAKLKVAGYKPAYLKDDSYYNSVIKRIKENPDIEFLGKANREEIHDLFAHAKAFIMPTKCDEAFGLVLIEAMACGTPVIAYNKGAVGEIVRDGEVGNLVEEGDIEGITDAIKKIDKISRKKCRQYIEETYSLSKMVENYLKTYYSLLN